MIRLQVLCHLGDVVGFLVICLQICEENLSNVALVA